MKLRDLRAKDLDELEQMQSRIQKELEKMRLEAPLKKSKNVKLVTNARREASVLAGLISGRKLGGVK